MKSICFLLLLPFFTYAQTVHIDDGKIVYKQTVKVKSVSKETLYERAQKVLLENVKGKSDDSTISRNDSGILESKGKLRLNSPYHIIRNVHYTITLNIDDGVYKYKIDSVYIKQKEKGGKTKVIPSEDLLKDMEITGVVAIETERQLNEIDMKFQKLIYLLNSNMKKSGKVKGGKNKNKA